MPINGVTCIFYERVLCNGYLGLTPDSISHRSIGILEDGRLESVPNRSHYRIYCCCGRL